MVGMCLLLVLAIVGHSCGWTFCMEQSKQKLIGKAFYSHYSVGDNVLEKWEALPLKDDSYLVTRHDGSKIKLEIGMEIDGVGLVELNEGGSTIKVGKWTLVIGQNIIPGWEAKPTRGKHNYIIRRPDAPAMKVKVGDQVPGMGIAHIDPYGNLGIGEKAVPIAKKQFQIQLVIFGEEEKGGYVSYFNYMNPGEKSGDVAGVKGIFYPSQGGKKPGRFCEYGEDGSLYNTAVFWPVAGKTFAAGKIRTLDDAIEEKAVYASKAEFEAGAAEIKMNPESMFGYSEIKDRLNQLNVESWKDHPFSVTMGHHIFKTTPARSNQRAKSSGYSPGM